MCNRKMKSRSAGVVGDADRLNTGIETFGMGFDTGTNNHFGNSSPAVRHLVLNFGLSVSVARVICDLSGFGGGRWR